MRVSVLLHRRGEAFAPIATWFSEVICSKCRFSRIGSCYRNGLSVAKSRTRVLPREIIKYTGYYLRLDRVRRRRIDLNLRDT